LEVIRCRFDAKWGNGHCGKKHPGFPAFLYEHDPPRFLTVGDEIALPVVLRNYLERRLQVKVEMKPSAWFSTIGPTTMKTDVSLATSHATSSPSVQ